MESISPDAVHALLMARQNELDTVRIYRHMLKQVRNSKTKEILQQLIDEEHNHVKRIDEKIKYGGNELPLSDEIEVDLPEREKLMEMELDNCSVSELIHLAIENEKISRDFYQAQHDRAEDEQVRKVFNWLVDQEVQHIDHLESEYLAHRDYEEVRMSDRDETPEANA
jgi:rubrerythrin